MLLFDIIMALVFTYGGLGAIYGVYALFADDQRNKGNELNFPNSAGLFFCVALIWPYLLTKHVGHELEERRQKKAALITKRKAQSERAAELHAKAVRNQFMEEVRNEAALKLRAEEEEHRIEHSKWDADAKAITESHYRQLTFDALRAERENAEMYSGGWHLLNRIIDEKIIEVADNYEFLDKLTPADRQLIRIRRNEISEQQSLHQRWGSINDYYPYENQ